MLDRILELVPRLRFPRVVVRVALIEPDPEADEPRAECAPVPACPSEVAPRVCEQRLADNLLAWRDRRRQRESTS